MTDSLHVNGIKEPLFPGAGGGSSDNGKSSLVDPVLGIKQALLPKCLVTPKDSSGGKSSSIPHRFRGRLCNLPTAVNQLHYGTFEFFDAGAATSVALDGKCRLR